MAYKMIDPSVIQKNLMKSTELILQFLHLYKEQIPTDLRALKEAVDAKTYSEIANRAHHIKPTMEYIGASTLREKLQQLEYFGKAGIETTDIQTLFKEIESDITILLQEISTYSKQL